MAASETIFENRHDAGMQLAPKLHDYRNQSAVVLAIPNGGVPVALEVASALKADLDLVVCRKIPMLINPEGSLGAAANDGTVIFNEEAIKRVGVSRQQLEYEISKVRGEIKQRTLLYKRDRPPVRLADKTVILIDEGLASGYTMMAAVESLRHRRPREIVVAVPVASAIAVKNVEKLADRVVTCITGYMPRFYVSDFYRYWLDVSDEDVIRYLKEWQVRQFRSQITPPEG